MNPTDMNLTYTIDGDDKVVETAGDWERFARKNSGSDNLIHSVLGTSLWDHITDTTTTQIYRSLFTAIRSLNKKVSFPLRCDSPKVKRYLQLTLTPSDDGAIRINSKLVQTEPIQTSSIKGLRVEKGDHFLTICSWCNKLKSDDNNYFEIETFISNHPEIMVVENLQITHGICRQCECSMEELTKNVSDLNES